MAMVSNQPPSQQQQQQGDYNEVGQPLLSISRLWKYVMTTIGLGIRNQVRPVGPQSDQVPQGLMLLHQLLQTLRSPIPSDPQQQVLQVFRSNPQLILMTAFIQHKQQHQQQSPAQQAAAQQGGQAEE